MKISPTNSMVSSKQRLPQVPQAESQTVQLLKEQNRSLKKEIDVLKESLDVKNFEVNQLKNENRELKDKQTDDSEEKGDRHQEIIDELKKQISNEKVLFKNFDKATHVVQNSLNKETQHLESQILLLQQSYKDVSNSLIGQKSQIDEIQKRERASNEVNEILQEEVEKLKNHIQKERERFLQEYSIVQQQLENQVRVNEEAMAEIFEAIDSVSQNILDIQPLPPVQVDDSIISPQENVELKFQQLLKDKDKLLQDAHLERERLIKHLNDQIQLRDQKIQVLQSNKMNSYKAGEKNNLTHSSSVVSVENQAIKELDMLLQNSQVALSKAVQEKEEIEKTLEKKVKENQNQERLINDLTKQQEKVQNSLETMQDNYDKLLSSVQFLKENVTHQFTLSEVKFAPPQETKVEIVLHQTSDSFYRDAMFEFSSQFPEMFTIQQQLLTNPEVAVPSFFKFVRDNMQSSQAIVKEIRTQVQTLIDHTGALKQGTEQKKIIIDLTQQVQRHHQTINDLQHQLKKLKSDSSAEAQEYENQIMELKKEVDDHNQLQAKFKSLQNLYNTTVQFHSNFEAEAGEKISTLETTANQLREELLQKEQEIDSLVQANKQMESSFMKISQENNQLQEHFSVYENESNVGQEKVQKKVARLESKYKRARNELKKAAVMINSANSEKAQLEKQVNQLKHKLQDISQTNEISEKLQTDKMKHLGEANQNLQKKLDSYLQEHDDNSQKLQKKLNAKKEKLQKLKLKVNEMSQNMIEKDKIINEERKMTSEHQKIASSTVEESKSQKEALNQVITSLTKKLNDSQKEIESLREQLEQKNLI